MNRQNWVHVIIYPWLDGDILEEYDRHHQEWVGIKPSFSESFDPIHYSPNINPDIDYRIKPRIVQYIIETIHHPSSQDFPRVADCMSEWKEGSFPPSFIEAVRNAKHLQ